MKPIVVVGWQGKDFLLAGELATPFLPNPVTVLIAVPKEATEFQREEVLKLMDHVCTGGLYFRDKEEA
jgi:hypothetical protein